MSAIIQFLKLSQKKILITILLVLLVLLVFYTTLLSIDCIGFGCGEPSLNQKLMWSILMILVGPAYFILGALESFIGDTFYKSNLYFPLGIILESLYLYIFACFIVKKIQKSKNNS